MNGKIKAVMRQKDPLPLGKHVNNAIFIYFTENEPSPIEKPSE